MKRWKRLTATTETPTPSQSAISIGKTPTREATMARPRDVGTRVETAIVKACHAAGFPYADRQPLRGARDQGDITVTPGVVAEAKGGRAAETASDNKIAEWMGELDHALANANADVALLVTKRAGVGHANAHRWWAHARLSDITGVDSDYSTIIRWHLADALAWLKREGW